MALYHSDHSLREMDRLQEQQGAYLDREIQKRISNARIVRERMVYQFQKEFILAVASKDGASMDFEAAKTRMEAATLHLYPAVTETNAAEYLNRAA